MSARPLTPEDIAQEGYTAASWAARARLDAHHPVLPVLPRPCGDCAVECGFYEPFAWSLAAQPQAIRETVLSRWWCHNITSRACRGAANVAKVFDFRRVARTHFQRTTPPQPKAHP